MAYGTVAPFRSDQSKSSDVPGVHIRTSDNSENACGKSRYDKSFWHKHLQCKSYEWCRYAVQRRLWTVRTSTLLSDNTPYVLLLASELTAALSEASTKKG